MKKILLLTGAVLLFGACQESLEDRASRELRDYTRKYCPTPVVDNQSADSAVFEAQTRTIHYYYKLYGVADNDSVIRKHEKEIRATLLKELKSNTKGKVYKDAGFSFRYTFRSASKPQNIILDETLSQKDYK